MAYGSGRKNEISRMSVLLCLLVVFIHVSSDPVSRADRESWQFLAAFLPWRLAAFATQGFIFLSALRLSLSNSKRSFLSYLGRRLRRVLIPYVIWNVIYYIYFMRRGYFGFEPERFGGYLLRGDLVSPFYFVVIIVQFYLLFPLTKAIARRVPARFGLPVFALLTYYFNMDMPRLIFTLSGHSFSYNDRLFTTYLFYWMLGTYAGVSYGAFARQLKKRKGLISVSFVSLAALNGGLAWLQFSGIARIPLLELIHYLYVISAILFFYLVMLLRTEKRPGLSALAAEIDSASYSIYLFHAYVINMVNEQLQAAGITRIGESWLLRAAAVYVICIAACVVWNRLSRAVTGLLR